jgi:hypothetical protein
MMEERDDERSPYVRAWELYHEGGVPEVPWVEAVDFHLQRGEVHATAEYFLMARPVDERCADLLENGIGSWAAGSEWWHVWVMAGDLECAVRELLRRRPEVRALSWTRVHGGGLRRCRAERFGMKCRVISDQ